MITKKESDDELDETKFIENLIDEDYNHDSLLNRILELLRKNIRHSKEISLIDCEEINDRLYYRKKMYVLDFHALKMRLCKEAHDSSFANHSERIKIFDLLQCHDMTEGWLVLTEVG